MGVEGRRRLEAEHARLLPRAERVAYLLTGDPELAQRLALKSFTNACGTWQDLREADALDTDVLRRVVNGVRRRAPFGRARPTPRHQEDGLWRAFSRLRVRQRAALVLQLYDTLQEQRAADVLQCSSKTFRALLTSGLERLAAEAGSSEPERLLRTAFERWAKELVLRAAYSWRISAGVWFRRSLTCAAIVIAFAAIVVGGKAVTRGLVAVAEADDETRSDEEVTGFLTENDAQTGHLAPQPYSAKFTAACPPPRLVMPIDTASSRGAPDIALAFNQALVEGDAERVRQLALPTTSIQGWGHTQNSNEIVVTASESAGSDGRVLMNCGARIAKRSWKVVIHDSNGVTGVGLATFYLARLENRGWRVWGSYEPPS